MKLFGSLSVIVMFSGPALADVACIQRFLSTTAFDPGPIDGAWGRKTETALQGLIEQLDLELDYEVSPGNSDQFCSYFEGPDGEQIAAQAMMRDYGIAINLDQLSAFTGTTVVDFSQVSVADDLNMSCRFTIERQVREDMSRIELMASGQLEIVAGMIEFATHSWRTRGLASEEYLQEEAVLAIDEEGAINGTMPYFHLFIDAGEVALPPEYVQLPREYVPDGVYPEGVTTFDVDDWQLGRLKIFRCS